MIYLVSEYAFMYSPIFDKKFKKLNSIPLMAFDTRELAENYLKKMQHDKIKNLIKSEDIYKYIPENKSKEQSDFLKKKNINKLKDFDEFSKVFDLDFFEIIELKLVKHVDPITFVDLNDINESNIHDLIN